jgi:hypothetical protein
MEAWSMMAEQIPLFPMLMEFLSILLSLIAIVLLLRGEHRSNRAFVFSLAGINLIPVLLQVQLSLQYGVSLLTPSILTPTFFLIAASSFLIWSIIARNSSHTHFIIAISVIFVLWIYLSRGLFAPFFDRSGLFIGLDGLLPMDMLFIAARFSLFLTCIVAFLSSIFQLNREPELAVQFGSDSSPSKRCDQCGMASDHDAVFCMHCGKPFP